MEKFFSVATMGFYAAEFHADYISAGTWPADAVEVDTAAEELLRAAVSRRDTIRLEGAEWKFTPASPPPFGPIASAYLNTVRAIREQTLNRLAGIGMVALLAGDTALAQAVATARQALLDITTAQAVLAATDVDELKAAVLDAFRAIVAVAPAALVRAFDAEGL